MIPFVLALSLSLAATPVITLERTACFGTCPAYKLTIFDDGKVLFEGREFVRVEGKAEGQISKKDLEALRREFERIDYFKLADRYGGEDNCPENWTDYPSANISFTADGKTKTIAHYLGCRGLPILDQLRALEDKIDAVVKTKQWIE